MNSLKYIDSLDTKKHLMLISDDINMGHTIEFHFIKRGLENNETCIYLTHGSTKQIEREMMQYGIDVNDFKKKKLLQVRQIQNPSEDSVSITDSVNGIMKKILPPPELPFRIVGRLIPDVGMEEAISIQAYLEKMFHNSIFDNLNGFVLCTYDISQIRANDEWKKWLHNLQESHHACIMNLNGQSSVIIN